MRDALAPRSKQTPADLSNDRPAADFADARCSSAATMPGADGCDMYCTVLCTQRARQAPSGAAQGQPITPSALSDCSPMERGRNKHLGSAQVQKAKVKDCVWSIRAGARYVISELTGPVSAKIECPLCSLKVLCGSSGSPTSAPSALPRPRTK